jgi:hypothetical protein
VRAAFALLLLAACARAPGRPAGEELAVCGGDEVLVLDVTDPSSPRPVWSWRAAGRPEIPEALRPRFGSTDDCKPVDGGAKILITSSGGGVALVERATGRALFWAFVRNAHSAEVLPGNRVVVAGSFGDDGNRLVLFDLAVPEKPLWWGELHGAHGAVWDAEARLLWALGEKELRAYAVEGDAPSLRRRWDLPDPGGHDLRPVPGTRRLVVTTGKRVWLFDRDRPAFEAHPDLGDLADVKGVDVNPRTGQVAYVKAEESWWARRVLFLDPGGELPLPDRRVYKARWAAAAN